MHKARSIQKWFTEISVEELDWPAQGPDLNPIEHLWDELEREPRLIIQNQYFSSWMLVAEWNQVPAAMFQHPVESRPRRVEAVREANYFGTRCLMSRCPHTLGHIVYIYILSTWRLEVWQGVRGGGDILTPCYQRDFGGKVLTTLTPFFRPHEALATVHTCLLFLHSSLFHLSF